MNIASMLLRILAILGAVAAAVMFFLLGNQKEELQNQLSNTEADLQQSQSQLRTVTQEKTELEEQASALTTQVEELESRSESLDNQLLRVRQELAEAREIISARDQEAETLRAEAGRIRRELLEERNRIATLTENMNEEDSAALRASIRELEQQLRDTEIRLQNVQSPSTQQVAEAQTEEQARPALRGEVTDVGPDSAFVLINLGSNDGIEANSSVMLRRGARYIGRANIVEVREDVSVARVSRAANQIQPGDAAISLN